MRVMKRSELLNLVQCEMSVFESMLSFACDINLLEVANDTMFDDNLRLRYKGLVIVWRL